MDLETLAAHMTSLKREYHEGHLARVIRLYDTCQSYRYAKVGADDHRSMAIAGGTTTIDLDSTTHDDILHIEAMMDHENTARDACYKAIAHIRSEITALQEIMKTCSHISKLVDDVSQDSVMGSEADMMAAWARIEHDCYMVKLGIFR